MEDNKMCCKPQFKCSICGKIYDKAIDRAKCEIECTKKLETEAKKAAEAKRQAEQQARKAELDEAMEHAYQLQRAYIKDYGSYSFKHVSNKSNQTDDVLTYPWHLFF